MTFSKTLHLMAPRRLLRQRPFVVPPMYQTRWPRTWYKAGTLQCSAHFRCFSSSSAANDDCKRSEHDLRVAQVQAQILARIQEQKQPAKTQEKEELQRISKEDLSNIMQTIHNWLMKDVTFFLRTMEAMDISLLEGEKSAAVSSSTGDAKIKSSSRRHSRNETDVDGFSHLFLSGHHPMQMVLNQYRQLYDDSILEFEELMQQNDCAFLLEHNIFQQLKDAGFADPQWSRRFRQVRGYEIQQQGLMQNLTKQEVDLQRHQNALIKSRREFKELKSMERLTSGTNRDNKSRARRHRKTTDEAVRRSTTKEISDTSSKIVEQTEQPQSFLQKVWVSFSSLLGVSPKPLVVEKKVPDTKFQSTENVLPPKPEKQKKVPPSKPKVHTRLQKLVLRKQEGLRRLEDQIEEATARLERTQRKIKELEIPLTKDEYERAQDKVSKVRDIICTEFARHMQDKHAHLIAQYETLNSKTDLTKPQEWFPYARLDRRKIIFHGGPTNSGKTYSALQRLKEAKQGLYLGPLRLLAAEIYETLTAEGLYTNLFTGQERREIAFSTHASATVEMFNASKEYDVAVIDEIQMVADPARGAAWTRALLGLRCKEIHVCGGMEAKNIVEKLAKACGDEFEIHTYDRFTELRVAERSLARNFKSTGAYRYVQPGDCVVAFSRNDIFAIKREIESTTNYKCCVIYGKLPPQTRADQARRFNDPNSGYDILVASDAIGMGLNLNIKRIIFNTIFKYNGDKIIRLGHSEVKQISGRAGRRNSPYPLGEVTCRDSRDLPFVRECLSMDIEPIEKAGLLPTAAHIELFSEAMNAYGSENDDSFSDLHQLLRQFNAMATVKGDYFLGRQHEMLMIAKRIKNVPLKLRDAYNMCLSPSTETSLDLLESFALKYSRGEVPGLPSRSVPKRAKSFDDLSNLCSIYSDSDLFLWLGLKFPPCNAVEQAAAISRKEKTLEYINEALAASERLKLSHCYLRQATRLRNAWETENGRSIEVGLCDDGEDEEDDDDDEYLLEERREAIY
ncbi:helicase domain protein [Nitzschia inconspicua]|uniref:RNA helicase n=1 Tax=Nitzschia inconspicua TaxID=303405 RepID=A0A9K3KEX9_9STRA|nr:helicase domain protein [Nitzschia inconspicua]